MEQEYPQPQEDQTSRTVYSLDYSKFSRKSPRFLDRGHQVESRRYILVFKDLSKIDLFLRPSAEASRLIETHKSLKNCAISTARLGLPRHRITDATFFDEMNQAIHMEVSFDKAHEPDYILRIVNPLAVEIHSTTYTNSRSFYSGELKSKDLRLTLGKLVQKEEQSLAVKPGEIEIEEHNISSTQESIDLNSSFSSVPEGSPSFCSDTSAAPFLSEEIERNLHKPDVETLIRGGFDYQDPNSYYRLISIVNCWPDYETLVKKAFNNVSENADFVFILEYLSINPVTHEAKLRTYFNLKNKVAL